jgi:hypothetical protein
VLPPGFEFLAYSTGAWHQGHQANPLLQTQAEGAATIGLAVGDNPADPLQSQGETFLNRQGCFHTITPVPIPQTEAHR